MFRNPPATGRDCSSDEQELAPRTKRLAGRIPNSGDREDWLGRLDRLRKSVGTDQTDASTEEILADLRSELQ